MHADHSLLLQIPVDVQSRKLDHSQTVTMEQKDHFVGIEMVRLRYVLLSITLLLTRNAYSYRYLVVLRWFLRHAAM